jgi:hypothetical protein
MGATGAVDATHVAAKEIPVLSGPTTPKPIALGWLRSIRPKQIGQSEVASVDQTKQDRIRVPLESNGASRGRDEPAGHRRRGADGRPRSMEDGSVEIRKGAVIRVIPDNRPAEIRADRIVLERDGTVSVFGGGTTQQTPR